MKAIGVGDQIHRRIYVKSRGVSDRPPPIWVISTYIFYMVKFLVMSEEKNLKNHLPLEKFLDPLVMKFIRSYYKEQS